MRFKPSVFMSIFFKNWKLFGNGACKFIDASHFISLPYQHRTVHFLEAFLPYYYRYSPC
jgi:hypothetical protein